VEYNDGKDLNELLDTMMSNDIYTEYRVYVYFYDKNGFNRVFDSIDKEDVIKILDDIIHLEPKKLNNNYDDSKLSRIGDFYSVSVDCRYYEVQDMGNYIRKEQKTDKINFEFMYENAVDVRCNLDTKYKDNYNNLYKLNGNYKFE